MCNTGASHTTALSMLKASFSLAPHCQSIIFLVNSVRGSARAAKFLMNCRKNYTKPKKDYTSLILVGSGHSLITLILLELMCKP